MSTVLPDLEPMPNSITIKRWFDILALAGVALVICILLNPALKSTANWLYGVLSIWGTSCIVVFALIVVALLALVLHALQGVRRCDFSREMLRYPSAWISALLAGLVFAGMNPECSNTSASQILWFLMLFGLVLAIGVWKSLRPDLAVQRGQFADGGEDLDGAADEKSMFWTRSEEPIMQPSEDEFGMADMARQIAGELHSGTVRLGVTGAFGCGKSSLLNLVEYYLIGDGDDAISDKALTTIVCRPAGWGVDRDTASGVILAAAVKSVSRYVDGLGLASLPSIYQRAAGGYGAGWLNALLIIASHREPLDVLRRLDAVLIGANLRLVIMLEDLDRNPDRSIFAGQVAALLDRLHQLQRISFVLAIGFAPGVTAILRRVCDREYLVPPISEDAAKRLVLNARQQWHARYGDIVTQNEEAANVRFGTSAELDPYFQLNNSVSDRARKPLDVILRITKVPRNLHFCLHHTDVAWNSVHGEVDLDCILLLNVLRVGAPEAIDFLAAEHDQLWLLQRSDDRVEQLREQLRSRWEAAIQNVPWDVSAAEAIIVWLYPGWSKHGRASMSLQDLQSAKKYWHIAFSGRLPDAIIQDQEIRVHSDNLDGLTYICS